MIGRAAVREHVFVLLFESIFNSPDDMDGVADAYFEGLDSPMDAEDSAYIEARFRAVEEKLPEIDRLIDEHSTGWKIGRIGKVELSILRLALYELKYDEDIPDKVAINEAVELAKKYGQEQAGAFVNGVLAKFAKENGEEADKSEPRK